MTPSNRRYGRDLLTRVIAPSLLLWSLLLGFGLALGGPLSRVGEAEESITDALAADRSDMWNSITLLWSQVGNIQVVIAIGVVVMAFLFWRTHNWRLTAVPALALTVEATIFVTVAALVGRERPSATQLDPDPATGSYPSGHVGATTALYVACALLALRIEVAWLRWTAVLLCITVPMLVGFSRLYRGMHHVTDVVAGLLNGLICALLAWGWYRNHQRSRP